MMYDILASNYDAIGLSQHSVELAELSCSRVAQRGEALDLGCGTGLAAEYMAAQGWQVTAVDQSMAMLEIARARARDGGLSIHYVHDDMRDLDQVQGSFELITCLGDSLAELVEEADLYDCFKSIAEHLKPGGIVAFDLRRRSLYERWDAYSEVLHDDDGLLAYVERDYVGRDKLASHRYVCFLRETELWWREEATIDTRFHDDTSLFDAMEQAGLGIIEKLNLQGQPAADDEEWVVFMSRQSDDQILRRSET